MPAPIYNVPKAGALERGEFSGIFAISVKRLAPGSQAYSLACL